MRFPIALALARAVSALVGAPALAEETGPLKPIDVKPALADLGKRMFYDTRLSGDDTLACASCHQPGKAFTDGEALSRAYSGAGHFRNAPTLANVGYRAAWLHDGRLGTNLNDVAREMITETYLMNMDMRIMQERMKQDPVYVEMFAAAGMSEPSNGGARNALQAFMQTIVSHGAPVDTGAMSTAARRGQGLFEGKAGGAGCHSGPRDTDGIWAKHWYANVERSTGFQPYKPKPDRLPEPLAGLHAKCLECYEKLYGHRLGQ